MVVKIIAKPNYIQLVVIRNRIDFSIRLDKFKIYYFCLFNKINIKFYIFWK